MRQAGRYLPEYREPSAREGRAISSGLCLNPEMAAEVTLQPMRRFAFDAAIVFADILLLPMGLGQKVWFEAGWRGPQASRAFALDLKRLARYDHLEASTGTALGRTSARRLGARVRAALEPERALIGFAGAPWTVATYMIEGGDPAIAAGRGAFAYQARRRRWTRLIEVLGRGDGAISGDAGQGRRLRPSSCSNPGPKTCLRPVFERIVTRPHAAIVQKLRGGRRRCALVIGFPRGASAALVEDYAVAASGVDAVALDVSGVGRARPTLATKTLTIQGALDPILLRAGGPALDRTGRSAAGAVGWRAVRLQPRPRHHRWIRRSRTSNRCVARVTGKRRTGA